MGAYLLVTFLLSSYLAFGCSSSDLVVWATKEGPKDMGRRRVERAGSTVLEAGGSQMPITARPAVILVGSVLPRRGTSQPAPSWPMRVNPDGRTPALQEWSGVSKTGDGVRRSGVVPAAAPSCHWLIAVGMGSVDVLCSAGFAQAAFRDIRFVIFWC